MANTKSAIKAARQNRRRYLRNKAVKSQLKTLSRKLAEASAGGKQDEARTLAIAFLSQLDKAVKSGVVHRNTVARHKSRWSKLALGAA